MIFVAVIETSGNQHCPRDRTRIVRNVLKDVSRDYSKQLELQIRCMKAQLRIENW